LMGGEISAQSAPGAGSVFRFTVPLGYAAEIVHPEPPDDALESVRLLVVDDDPSVGRMIERYAASWGMQVRVAGDRDGALALLRDAAGEGAPIDLAIVDYVMPQVNGIELGREIASDAAYGAPALVLLTAFHSGGRDRAAREAGFSGYLTKPCPPSTLYDCLAQTIGTRFSSVVAAPQPHAAAGEPRLLLAEDQAVNRRVASLQLRELGYAVEVAGNGREAVEAVRRSRYDLVLMDLHMPEMDGITAAKMIREHEVTAGTHVTIVALTANALDEDRRRCLAAGMDDYLSKPLQIDALKAMLERWLPQKGPVCSP
ncbi:MAG TPA: response regulator, partial [Candidatus Elarobacter sp.]